MRVFLVALVALVALLSEASGFPSAVKSFLETQHTLVAWNSSNPKALAEARAAQEELASLPMGVRAEPGGEKLSKNLSAANHVDGRGNPLRLVQIGEPRSASTFQWYMLCSVMRVVNVGRRPAECGFATKKSPEGYVGVEKWHIRHGAKEVSQCRLNSNVCTYSPPGLLLL